MENNISDITVSICCITYNHENFIAKAIEGFLMQKTSFKYEILIGEDCSKDKTASIVQSYAEKYPELIRVITSANNVGSIRNQVRVFKEVKGKYIAFCDGDDYWTDPTKLQQQVDFLESNPQYVMCCHYSKVVDGAGNTLYAAEHLKPLEYSYEDLLLGEKNETRIGTAVFRNTAKIKAVDENEWYYKTNGTDAFLKLYITAITNSKIYVIPKIMGCYRHHEGGVWSMIDCEVRKHKMISDFNIVINNFSYSSQQRRKLLKIYMRKFFLFEVRNLKLNRAFNTIFTLV